MVMTSYQLIHHQTSDLSPFITSRQMKYLPQRMGGTPTHTYGATVPYDWMAANYLHLEDIQENLKSQTNYRRLITTCGAGRAKAYILVNRTKKFIQLFMDSL